MKKTATVLTILLIILSAASAANSQKVIPLSSGLYDAMDALYILEGKAMPSTTRPWTVAEAKKYLGNVSESTSPELYAYILREMGRKPLVKLADDAFDAAFLLKANLNLYYHSNTAFDFPFDEVENQFFRMGHRNDKATFRFDADAQVGQTVYLFYTQMLENADWAGGTPFYSRNFNYDIVFCRPDGFTFDINVYIPDRAFAVIGGQDWNIQLGKDRFSVGSGKTGNLIVSDNFPYHHLLRFNAFGSRYKFSFVVSSFWHPEVLNGVSAAESEGIYLYMMNRVEGHYLSDRLYFAFDESMMWKDDTGVFNLRYMSPTDYFHNFFVGSKQNARADIEIIWGVTKGLNAYFQAVFDDIASPREHSGGATAPNQIGFLAGLRHVSVLGKGILGVNLEAVYTYPYLYLRSTYRDDQPADDPGLGYIGIVRAAGDAGNYQRHFVGYTYGGNAAVLDLEVTYRQVGNVNVGAEFFYMIHGLLGPGSPYDWLYKSSLVDEKDCVLSEDRMNYGYVRLTGRKEISDILSAYAQYDFAFGSGGTDHQVTIGANLAF
ncbi:MAG: hypothetical protein J5775_07315 [Spirochaetales bacterium]|nr:hypothetical protein [Spirochaetales bacterium]